MMIKLVRLSVIVTILENTGILIRDCDTVEDTIISNLLVNQVQKLIGSLPDNFLEISVEYFLQAKIINDFFMKQHLILLGYDIEQNLTLSDNIRRIIEQD